MLDISSKQPTQPVSSAFDFLSGGVVKPQTTDLLDLGTSSQT